MKMHMLFAHYFIFVLVFFFYFEFYLVVKLLTFSTET